MERFVPRFREVAGRLIHMIEQVHAQVRSVVRCLTSRRVDETKSVLADWEDR
ncbi:hypothetical protein OG749_10430 [Streptomyces nojiriensis]|uniref:hypothetical protein n=1 Tax=Streptomyces nojiriensis TaxID=66374 RepID=UPI002E190501